MRKKLDVDVADYLILGACNPSMALEAMKIEPKVAPGHPQTQGKIKRWHQTLN